MAIPVTSTLPDDCKEMVEVVSRCYHVLHQVLITKTYSIGCRLVINTEIQTDENISGVTIFFSKFMVNIKPEIHRYVINLKLRHYKHDKYKILHCFQTDETSAIMTML